MNSKTRKLVRKALQENDSDLLYSVLDDMRGSFAVAYILDELMQLADKKSDAITAYQMLRKARALSHKGLRV